MGTHFLHKDSVEDIAKALKNFFGKQTGAIRVQHYFNLPLSESGMSPDLKNSHSQVTSSSTYYDWAVATPSPYGWLHIKLDYNKKHMLKPGEIFIFADEIDTHYLFFSDGKDTIKLTIKKEMP